MLTSQNFSESLSQKLSQTELPVNYQQRANIINTMIESSASSLVRMKTIKTDYAKRWYNQTLKNLKKLRDDAEMAANLNGRDVDWKRYRQARNLYNRRLNESKNADLRSMIMNCNGDQKKLWRQLKNFIDCSDPLPSCIVFNGESVTDSSDLANRLNQFFVNSIKEIKQSIPFVSYLSDITEYEITPWNEFMLVNEAMVRRVVQDMRSKSGMNNVNKNVVGFAIDAEIDLILDFFNDSLIQGVVPDSGKFTVVVPIPKVKGTTKPDEIRPVNTCPTLYKVLEILVKEQLYDHIKQNQLIDPCQSAYVEKHSCETAINYVLNNWIEMREQKMNIVAVFLDLSRAFETVDRAILIDIMGSNGIGGTVLNWFKSWLSNRKQYMKCNETLSDPIDVENGVPQGTPLSALFFIMYINLIVKRLRFCKMKLFADDCLIWFSCSDFDDAMQKMNEDLERISQLLKMLKLKLNVKKTKFMIFHGRNEQVDMKLEIDNTEIERVDSFKYLGVLIDDRLDFNSHCDYTTKKMAKKVNFIGRIRNKIDSKTALLLFKSIIVPHYDYCASILFLLNKTQINLIQMIQNRALRIILKAKRDTSTSWMHEKLNLMTVNQRIHFNVMILMFKAKKSLLPPYICNQLVSVSNVQPYQLRNNSSLRPPSRFSQLGQRSLLYKGVTLFNTMKDSVRIDQNIKDFKSELMIYVKEKF